MGGRELGGDMEGSWVEIGVEAGKKTKERIRRIGGSPPSQPYELRQPHPFRQPLSSKGGPGYLALMLGRSERLAERLRINAKYPEPPSLERGCLNCWGCLN